MEEVVQIHQTLALAPFTHRKMKTLPTIHTNSENNHISPTNQ